MWIFNLCQPATRARLRLLHGRISFQIKKLSVVSLSRAFNELSERPGKVESPWERIASGKWWEKFLAFLSDESKRLGELSARCSFIERPVKPTTRDLLGRTNKTKSGHSFRVIEACERASECARTFRKLRVQITKTMILYLPLLLFIYSPSYCTAETIKSRTNCCDLWFHISNCERARALVGHQKRR